MSINVAGREFIDNDSIYNWRNVRYNQSGNCNGIFGWHQFEFPLPISSCRAN